MTTCTRAAAEERAPDTTPFKHWLSREEKIVGGIKHTTAGRKTGQLRHVGARTTAEYKDKRDTTRAEANT